MNDEQKAIKCDWNFWWTYDGISGKEHISDIRSFFFMFPFVLFSLCSLQMCNILTFTGPEFWGILNPDWFLCSKGHRQSPIDIKPGLLLYDPNLKSIFINKNK